MKFAEYIKELRNAIHTNFGCESVHVQTYPTKLMHQEEIVWEGNVEGFMLLKCTAATEGYGWLFKRDDGGMDYVTILKVHSVTSPEKAVQAYVLSQKKAHS